MLTDEATKAVREAPACDACQRSWANSANIGLHALTNAGLCDACLGLLMGARIEREAALVQERDAVELAAFYGSDGYLDPEALRRWVAFGGVPMTEATRDHLRQGLRAVVGQVMSDLSAGTWCAFDLRAVLLEMADEADPRKPFKKGAVPPKPAPAAKEDR